MKDDGLNVRGSEQRRPRPVHPRLRPYARTTGPRCTLSRTTGRSTAATSFSDASARMSKVQGASARGGRVTPPKAIRPMNEHLLMAQARRSLAEWRQANRGKGPGTRTSKTHRDRPRAGAIGRGRREADSASPATTTSRTHRQACPMSAHVRVAYPRNVLDASGIASLVEASPSPKSTGEKGPALRPRIRPAIKDGFEFIQANWLNSTASPEV